MPNSGIRDPMAQRLFRVQGCAPATCCIDAIQSRVTNEITINWNAALSQYAAFLAEQ
jgi:endoglucanase